MSWSFRLCLQMESKVCLQLAVTTTSGYTRKFWLFRVEQTNRVQCKVKFGNSVLQNVVGMRSISI